MSPRTNEQYEKIRSEKRKLIMDVALEIFAERTFQGTTIGLIAEKANISKGLMYNYFESKEALLKAIVSEGIHDVWRFFDPNHDGILSKDEFFFFITKSIEIVKANPNYWKLYSSLMFQSDILEMVISDYDELSKQYSQLAYNLFVRYNLKDPEAEIILLGAMIKGAIIQYVTMKNGYPVEKFTKAIIDYYKIRLDR
jgi:AcrR family transcriptional regulator